MKYRTLGKKGPKVSSIGLGCMGLSEFYGSTENTEKNNATQFIRNAYYNGITFFDTADMYGMGSNETLLGNAIAPFRDKVVIATKCGIERDETKVVINNAPEYIKQACDRSLQRLSIETIDLYFLHRHDPAVPIEDIMRTMLELVEEKKIRYIGLSEVDAQTIERAYAIAGDKLVAVQSEFSMVNCHTARRVLPTCKKLGLAFIAYSPLARGLLSGTLKNSQQFSASTAFDYRSTLPQFAQANLPNNLRFIEEIELFAEHKKCTPAQLALAWLLAQGDYVVPIPGTTDLKYLVENSQAVKVKLSTEDLKVLELIMKENPIQGNRYPDDESFITWDRK